MLSLYGGELSLGRLCDLGPRVLRDIQEVITAIDETISFGMLSLPYKYKASLFSSKRTSHLISFGGSNGVPKTVDAICRVILRKADDTRRNLRNWLSSGLTRKAKIS